MGTDRKMLITLNPKDILLVRDWEVIHFFEDPLAGNVKKFWISPLPGFDEDTFPFVLTSSWEAFTLLNIKTYHMEQLILASGRVFLRQEAAFFSPLKDGFTMTFAKGD